MLHMFLIVPTMSIKLVVLTPNYNKRTLNIYMHAQKYYINLRWPFLFLYTTYMYHSKKPKLFN